MKDANKNDSGKKNAGYKAAEYVEDGMVLGLGTGSTTHYFIEKVGMRMAEEGIKVQGIPTSFQSLLLAKKWNIPIKATGATGIKIYLWKNGVQTDLFKDFNTFFP